MAATQSAYRLHGYGGPENLQLDEGLPIPSPGPSEVLVMVSTVAINPFDWKIREGYMREMMPLTLPTALGVDYVGTVVALGSEAITRFRVGDRVMSFSPTLGAWAEYIAVPEANLCAVPAGLSDVVAATVPIPATTAYQSLFFEPGAVRPDMRILIHGASGVVGALAVQLAKAAGAYVIGTASTKNREYVLGLGADEFVDYNTEKFEDKVAGVDLVLDYVLIGGAMDTTARSFKVLKRGGAVVSAADPAVTAKTPEGYRGFFPTITPDPTVLGSVAEKLAAGTLVSKIAQVYPRTGLKEALRLSQVGGRAGRMIVDFKNKNPI